MRRLSGTDSSRQAEPAGSSQFIMRSLTSRRVSRVVVAAVVLGLVGACREAPIAPAAQARGLAGVAVKLMTNAAASPAGIAAEWAHGDHLWIHVDQGGARVIDTVLAFDPAAPSIQARFAVTVDSGARPATLAVEVREGMHPIFRGFSTFRLGAGQTVSPTVQLSSLTPSVAASNAATCAIAQNGAMQCWGYNGDGQIGNPSVPFQGIAAPTAVSGGLVFRSVAAGGENTCGLTNDGSAYCWGQNQYGQVGNGSIVTVWPFAQRTPVRVPNGPYVAISVGGNLPNDFVCALTAAGDAYCWGANDHGMLGNGTTTTALTPSAVAGGLKFSEVTAGAGSSACGVTTTHDAFCWGQNDAGQLGDATTTDRPQPVKVGGGHAWVSLAPAARSTCGITVAGETLCWGNNDNAQLANGKSGGSSSSPAPVQGAPALVSLSASQNYTCGVTADSHGYCWGGDYMGRTGAGNLETVASVYGGGRRTGAHIDQRRRESWLRRDDGGGRVLLG